MLKWSFAIYAVPFLWPSIRMYNMNDGILGIKFSIHFVNKGYKFQSFLEALWSMVLVGGVEEAEGDLKEMRFMAVLLCGVI